jgi:DNA-binding transcriptional MerR regulator
MEHESTTKLYKVREFATLAGVTVRALHHYDRLGLLTPARRAGSSYRLYSERDLARLEEIVVLKFLGIPLKEIRPLLGQQSGLAGALRRQQRVLGEKRRQLEQAIATIAAAERSTRSATGPDWALFRHVIQEIEMQNETDWTKKYYSARGAGEDRAAQADVVARDAGRSEPQVECAVRRHRSVAGQGSGEPGGAGARRTMA